MSELLPCPFCGDAPYARAIGGPRELHIIGCKNDGCEINPKASGETKEAVTEVWNTRASPAATPTHDREPDAWEWRACIGGKWGAWLYVDQPIGYFKGRNAFNLDNGTYELRPLYAVSRPHRGAE